MKRYYFEPIFTKVQVEFLEEVLAGSAEDAVGGVVGGGITFVTFKPCCDKLKASLQNTMLSNPNYQQNEEDTIEIVVEE